MSVSTNVSKELEDWPYTDPPTIIAYDFEKFDAPGWRRWMYTNWPLSIHFSILYLVFIVYGQRFMRNREPFNLKVQLIIWNMSLALFSLCGFIRTFPELLQVLNGPDGLHRSVCVRDNLNPSSIFWALLFTCSKVVELGDTAFLVLRKKPVIFLHWYHHLTVMVFCWATYSDYEPSLRWFGVVNLLVHFYMYLYFSMMAMGIRLWKSVSITVTTFQLSQMFMGVAINVYAIWMKNQGQPCARSQRGLNIHLTMYGSYLILFCQYFYKAYLNKKPKIKRT